MALFSIKAYYYDTTVTDDLGFPIVTATFDETNIGTQRKTNTILIYIKYVPDPMYGISLYTAVEPANNFNLKAYCNLQGNVLRYAEWNSTGPQSDVEMRQTNANRGGESTIGTFKERDLQSNGIFTGVENVPENVFNEIMRRFSEDQNSTTMAQSVPSRKK